MKKENLQGISFSISANKEQVKVATFMSTDDYLSRIAELTKWAKEEKLLTRCYISEALEWTLDNRKREKANVDEVVNVAKRLDQCGVDEIVLQGGPAMYSMKDSLSLLNNLDHLKSKLGIHVYDTALNGLEMMVLALSQGVNKLTTSVGGLGKHKYFDNLMGNVVASDLVFALECMDIKHDVKWRKLLEAEENAARWLKRKNISDVFTIDFKEKLGEYKEAVREEMESFYFA